MKKYDVIVIGSGAGAIISDEAVNQGLKVALVDRGPLLGGTCLNWGCIPSKMLIYAADRIVEIEEAKKLGIKAAIDSIDFISIMNRMRKSRQASQVHIRQGIKQAKNLDFYEGVGFFVGDHLLEVNGKELKADSFYIASGSRPLIPPIKGLANVNYLTNESVLELIERPDSLIVVGGGYVAVEFGHFFAAMGTKVTILEMADRLLLTEEMEISNLLKSKLSKRMDVYTGNLAEEVRGGNNQVTVITKDIKTGKQREFSAKKLMMAVGRVSNADILKVADTGVEINEKGFIKVNEYLETNRNGIYAIGDANGKQMFRHMANKEAEIVVQNAFYNDNIKVDYSVVPHAVYSYPQIASVGLTELQAREYHEILIGKVDYLATAKGEAMMEEDGFAKIVVEKDSYRILGFHIIGPNAPELIQEVVNAMTSGGGVEELSQGIHIHPALSELVQYALSNLEAV
jgi:dihydrolipoamide dehydrogenase